MLKSMGKLKNKVRKQRTRSDCRSNRSWTAWNSSHRNRLVRMMPLEQQWKPSLNTVPESRTRAGAVLRIRSGVGTSDELLQVRCPHPHCQGGKEGGRHGCQGYTKEGPLQWKKFQFLQCPLPCLESQGLYNLCPDLILLFYRKNSFFHAECT